MRPSRRVLRLGLLPLCLTWVACSGNHGDEPTRPAGPTTPQRTADTTPTADSGRAGSELELVPASACTPGDLVYRHELLDHAPQPEHRFAGGGAAFLDVDGDGHDDLVVTGNDGIRLLLGPDFGTDGPVPDLAGPIAGATTVDIDDDGDLDLLLTVHGPPDIMLRNDDGALRVDEAFVFPGGFSQSAAFHDVTGDGHLDMLIAGHGIPDIEGKRIVINAPASPTRLLAGPLASGFVDQTDTLPQPLRDAYSYVVAPISLGGDARADLYTANDYPNYLTQQAAIATDDGWESPVPDMGLHITGAGMGMGIGDVNDDGIDDILLPIWNRLQLLTSRPGVGWVETASRDGLTLPRKEGDWVAWGGELADLDHDGRLDVLIAFGHLHTLTGFTVGGADASNNDDQPMLAWLQQADGRFALTEMGLPRVGAHRGFALHDVDGDGSLDIAAPRLDGGIDLLRGPCPTRSWLSVAIDQAAPNVDGVGTVVEATASGRTVRRTVRAGGTSVLSSHPPVAHFGLGAADSVDLDVTYPDGVIERFEGVPTGIHVVIHRDR